MWVRSQNKRRFLEVKDFSINDTDVEAVFGDYRTITLGRYSTVEKAIEVLNKIEQHLITRSKIVEKSMGEYIISDLNSIVFQMPEDKEV